MTILKIGSQGADVLTLQQHLQNLRYTISPDGDFGPNTQQAVIQFQTANGLPGDGVVGPETLAKIDALLAPPVSSIEGIDISHNNGPINWSTLPADDISFVYCKASQGATFKDPTLASNIVQLNQLQIFYGAYHFLTFQNATAAQQANNFLSCGIDFSKPGVLPPVLDVEWQVPATLNPYLLANKQGCIQLISDWLTTVAAQTGRTPIIYTNSVFWHDYLGNPPGFGQYPLWIAAYQNAQPTLPSGWTNYAFWQFSGNGTISSVSGVDRDRFNGSMAELQNLAQPAV